MKIVFSLQDLTEAIEDAAGNLFEEQGGTLNDEGLTLVGLMKDTQEMLFALSVELPKTVLVDMSPTSIDESAPTEAPEIVAGPNA